MSQHIEIDKRGAIWRIVINRPEVKNAHDLQTFKELVAAFDQVEADPGCRCAVLTGAGDFFSAGQDLRFTAQADAMAIDDYGRWNVAARQRIQRNFKPVVAGVNGPAIGGGVYLATACDLVVAVDTSFFQMREIQAGNHSGGAFLFTVGRARSLELSLLGGRLPAAQALEWGLINRCVAADGFESTVDELATALSELPPLAIRYTKNATNLLLDMAGFSTHMEAGAPMQRYLGLTPDGREAKRAFNERRKPAFTGAFPRVAD
ncbi:MAG: enoyl-CoA hydratase-related protein [Pigmentiphaga sp.]|uniref:enoyl-CoA hydratase/isomerase family protein n=1 Tax=Pigmentiphaga sp. TaxID=1977564 RepID=UPI0029B2B9DA|nr:enoyl-CoA hydratase-related protein [Pigmentiphaga sp.]MDX3906143.1 enoyl-CoA hydratase-related protein [Pigmentiphaga sp.]